MSSSPAILPGRFRYRLSPVRGLWIIAVSLAVLFTVGLFVSESLAKMILEDLQKQPAWVLAVVGDHRPGGCTAAGSKAHQRTRDFYSGPEAE